jgi:hypothetical protein
MINFGLLNLGARHNVLRVPVLPTAPRLGLGRAKDCCFTIPDLFLTLVKYIPISRGGT